MLSRNSWMSTTMPLVLSTSWCVVAAICAVSDDIFVSVSMVFCISSACLSMSAMRSWLYFSFIVWFVLCWLIWNGIVECSMGLPSGRVIVCTSLMPGTAVTALAILLMTRKSAEFRRSWSLSTIISSG